MKIQNNNHQKVADLWVDGAARGNPGPAAYGIILKIGDNEIKEHKYLGIATNNVAEYSALIAGLELAINQSLKQVFVYSDSELVVRQLSGQYKVKNENLKGYYDKTKDLLSRISAEIKHVSREYNSKADALANKALDEQLEKQGSGFSGQESLPEN